MPDRYLARMLPDRPYWGLWDTRTARFVVGEEYGVEAWATAAAARVSAAYRQYREERRVLAAAPDALGIAATEMVAAETKTEPLWVALLIMIGAVIAGTGIALFAGVL